MHFSICLVYFGVNSVWRNIICSFTCIVGVYLRIVYIYLDIFRSGTYGWGTSMFRVNLYKG